MFIGFVVLVDMKEIYYIGIGRYGWFIMCFMSFWELGEFIGEVSLLDLFFIFDRIGVLNKLILLMFVFVVCCGGWFKFL